MSDFEAKREIFLLVLQAYTTWYICNLNNAVQILNKINNNYK